MEEELAGKRGLLTQVVDVAGLPVRVVKRDEPVAGQNVRLTIDSELQKNAEQMLIAQINYINSKAQHTVTQSGTVIALNPNTGEILAMVSWPSYDNTRFARNIDAEYYLRVLNDSQLPLVNHAISSLYPPGSVWKLITAVGVTQEKVIAPDQYLFDPGELFVQNSFAKQDPGSRQRFVCWFREGHKNVDLIHGIAWSCDVYFYQVGGGNPAVSEVKLRKGGLGIDDLDRYATMFGIGTRLGVELPGEVSGRMPDPDWKRRIYGESWSTGDTYNAAFGQGYVTVTPIQLISAVASIVSGGTLYQPTLINSWVDSEGNTLVPFTPHINRTLLLPPEDGLAVLNPREDMYVQGKASVACTCDPFGPYNDKDSKEYDPNQLKRCTEEFKKNYRVTVHLDGTTAGNRKERDVQYTVNVPNGYGFGGMCDPLQFKPNYQPPFVDAQNLNLVRLGMHAAVSENGGTAQGRMISLAYADPAGKTGTAEYCDNIANQQGLCIPGSWPSHAWFIGYAPFDKPEIIAVTFVYNAGEGSVTALPVVRNLMNCYFLLKNQREQTGSKGPFPACPIDVISLQTGQKP